MGEVELAELICARFASIQQVRFTNSGTEANVYAVAALHHTQRRGWFTSVLDRRDDFTKLSDYIWMCRWWNSVRADERFEYFPKGWRSANLTLKRLVGRRSVR